jgi:phosphatidate phosphatase APP1
VVVPYVGYGGEGWAWVLAPVHLAPPGSPRREVDQRRGWRLFFSPSKAGVPVTVRLGDDTHVVISGRKGYVDVRLSASLAAGWATALLSVGDADPVETPMRIVGPNTTFGLVSDVDDTVIVTMLPRPLVALRNALFVKGSDRWPVPGMAELYRQIVDTHPDAFVVYVSTGAWDTAVAMCGFLARHGYPPGPLLLTHWGPTDEGWNRSGAAHKREQLRRLFAELPELRWLLVGDDGQHDPSLYAAAAEAAPDKVLGIAIRQLTVAEHVVRHGVPVSIDGLAHRGAELSCDPVRAPDGVWLARGCAGAGSCSPGNVPE